MEEIKIFGGELLEEQTGRHQRIWKRIAMINHRKIDLRMGDGWNWFRTISNSLSGNSGSATGQKR